VTQGGIVRYGPNRFSIDDPEASKIIYGHGKQFAKSDWYVSWGNPGTWTLFSDTVIKRHAHVRKQFQNDYSMTSLVSYEPYADECAELFSQRLQEVAAAHAPIDMGHWFQCYAFDVIGLITYGSRLGFLDRGDDVAGVMQALDSHTAYSTLVSIYPGLHSMLFRIRNYMAGNKGAGRAYVLSFTQDRIAEHKARPKTMDSAPDQGEKGAQKAEPFLSRFLAKYSSNPQTFEAPQIIGGCMQNMVAGSDTTAISLSATLYHLLRNPGCMGRLRREIDDFTAAGNLSKFPTFKESQQMPYLQAVLKEALRIHPATGLPLERVVPDGGVTISGRFFPEGVSRAEWSV
jgi:cytochrome P450